jgi:hypothetical protein
VNKANHGKRPDVESQQVSQTLAHPAQPEQAGWSKRFREPPDTDTTEEAANPESRQHYTVLSRSHAKDSRREKNKERIDHSIGKRTQPYCQKECPDPFLSPDYAKPFQPVAPVRKPRRTCCSLRHFTLRRFGTGCSKNQSDHHSGTEVGDAVRKSCTSEPHYSQEDAAQQRPQQSSKATAERAERICFLQMITTNNDGNKRERRGVEKLCDAGLQKAHQVDEPEKAWHVKNEQQKQDQRRPRQIGHNHGPFPIPSAHKHSGYRRENDPRKSARDKGHASGEG